METLPPNSEAKPISSQLPDRGKLGKGYWTGGKAGEFEAGQDPTLNRAMKGIRLGELKPAVLRKSVLLSIAKLPTDPRREPSPSKTSAPLA